MKHFSGILKTLFIATFLFSEAGQSAVRCGDYVRQALLSQAATNPNGTGSADRSSGTTVRPTRAPRTQVNQTSVRRAEAVKPKLNSREYTEKLDLPFEVKNANGEVVGASLKEALNKPEVQSLLQSQQSTPYRVLLRAKVPESQGGGELRLTTLNTSQGNYAYNHVELVALLKVNPELANELGIYRVEGYNNMAWVADMPALNYRMRELARKYGYNSVKWDYAEAQGVVSTMPYLELLQKGKFPFSGEADINLSVHDGMHAVAFSVMNITHGGREVLDAARTRNEVILKIHARLKELPNGEYMANNFIENIAKHLSPDSLERTMLLSIILTGNYDYFSAGRASDNPMRSSPQNRQVTQQRIVELLKLFRDGQMTFASALDRVLPPGSEGYQQVKNIFVQEIAALKNVPDQVLNAAATDMLQFIPDQVLISADTTGSIKPSERFPDVGQSPGPETLTAD